MCRLGPVSVWCVRVQVSYVDRCLPVCVLWSMSSWLCRQCPDVYVLVSVTVDLYMSDVNVFWLMAVAIY